MTTKENPHSWIRRRTMNESVLSVVRMRLKMWCESGVWK